MKRIVRYSPYFDTEDERVQSFRYLMEFLAHDIPQNVGLPADIHIEIEQKISGFRFVAVIIGNEKRAIPVR